MNVVAVLFYGNIKNKFPLPWDLSRKMYLDKHYRNHVLTSPKVPRKYLPWSIYFDIRMLPPMSMFSFCRRSSIHSQRINTKHLSLYIYRCAAKPRSRHRAMSMNVAKQISKYMIRKCILSQAEVVDGSS